jgi:hypothetical protein
MRKPRRTTREIQKIADQLRECWFEDLPIAWFLRRSLPTIDKLVRDEFVSVRDIARALTYAGITYQTRNAWTERNLSRDIGKARRILRDQQDGIPTRSTRQRRRAAHLANNPPGTAAAKRWAAAKSPTPATKPVAMLAHDKGTLRLTVASADLAPKDRAE